MLVAAIWAPASLAAKWEPEKLIEIVVPAAAGGGTDRTARLMQKIFVDLKSLPMPTVVVNKPGAGSSMGNRYVIQHEGDGHYLGITQPTLLTDAITGMSTIGYTNVTPLAQLGTEYIGFAVKADSPLKTPKDIIDRLKKDPGSVSFGISNAIGAPGHIALGLVMRQAGIDPSKLTVVVFPSGGQSMTTLLGGHVDVITTTVANLLGMMGNGMIRTLAVTAPKRMGGPFSDTPTWKEKGIDVVIGNWRGVVGPPGMTADQIAFWDSKLAALAASDEWKSDAERNAVGLEYLNSKDSKIFLTDQYSQMRRILSDLGLATTK